MPMHANKNALGKIMNEPKPDHKSTEIQMAAQFITANLRIGDGRIGTGAYGFALS